MHRMMTFVGASDLMSGTLHQDLLYHCWNSNFRYVLWLSDESAPIQA